MGPAARLFFLIAFGLACLTITAGDASADQRADRRSVERLTENLPAPPDGWNAVRTDRDWRGGGARVRRTYRGPEGRTVKMVLETRTRGILYKHDLLANAERAVQFGYSIEQIGEQNVLVKPGEMRFWLDERVLVLIRGDGTRDEMAAFVEALDFEKLASVR